MNGSEKRIRCSICKKTFACQRYLVKHISRVHSKEKEDRKPLECSICGKNFPRLSHLQRHQLIHIKEREWGCPFCEQSFVQKPHLMRHIGRRHASQYQDGLGEKIAANKWRTETKPLDVEMPKKCVESSAFSQQCGDLISRMLCLHCGSTFDNRTDLDRHINNTHRSLKCKHCGDLFDGYASLKAHELRQRAQAYACSCGASFKRQPELRAHRDSCRKRGSFLCLVCERVFTQRVQLDRHWNKEHFVSAQCGECGWIAAAPLRKAEHAQEVHKKNVCGYCGIDEPPIDHVSKEHWKRLKKSIPMSKSIKNQDNSSDNPWIDASIGLSSSGNIDEDQKYVGDEERKADIVSSVEASSTTSTSSSETETGTSSLDEEGDLKHMGNESPSSNLLSEERHLNVVLSVPDDVVDEFYFGDRLPAEIRRLFPELVNARVCIVEPFVGQKRFLSLHIPVLKPSESDANAERLLSVPIYV